jgi:hypothetical protein
MNKFDLNDLLVEYEEKHKTKTKLSNKPLHNSVLNNNYEEALKLIKEGVDLNQIDESLKTPLMLAIEQANIPIISLLLDSGCDVQAHSPTCAKNALILGCLYDLEPSIFLRIIKESNLSVSHYAYKDKKGEVNPISTLELCLSKPKLSEEILKFIFSYQKGYIFTLYLGDTFKEILGKEALEWYEKERKKFKNLASFQRSIGNYKEKILDKDTMMDVIFLAGYSIACLIIYGFYLYYGRNIKVPLGIIAAIIISIPFSYSLPLVFLMPFQKIGNIIRKLYYYSYKKLC